MEDNTKYKPVIISIVVLLLIVIGVYFLKDKKAEGLQESENPEAALDQNANVPNTSAMANVVSNPFTMAAATTNTQSASVPKAEITLLAPAIAASNDTELKPGKHEIKWTSKNADKIIISVIETDGTVLVSSGPVAASAGTYTLDIPEPKSGKGNQSRYIIALADTAHTMIINSYKFTLEKN